MMYRVPHGHVLLRPDTAEQMRGGIHLATADQERPPTGVVVMVADRNMFALSNPVPVDVRVNDRVHHKQYGGVELELEMPDSPDVVRCEHCNFRLDDPELPEKCAKRFGDDDDGHRGGEPTREPELLLVLNLADVVLVEVHPDNVPPPEPSREEALRMAIEQFTGETHQQHQQRAG